MAKVTLVTVRNPFDLNSREVKELSYVPGEPVYHYIYSTNLTPPEDELVVSRNGAVVPTGELMKLIPNPGDYLAVCPVVGKDDNDKSIIQIIAVIVITAVTYGAAGPSGAAMGFGEAFGLATTLVNIGGALLGPKPNNNLIENNYDPAKSWGQLQPLRGQGNPIPITYGKVRTAGQIVAQHLSVEGNKQCLNVLLCGGEGEIDYPEGTADDGLDQIKINGNEIVNFGAKSVTRTWELDDGIEECYGDKVEVFKRYGSNTQKVIDNFNDTYFDQYLNIELDEAVWSDPVATGGDNGTRLEVTIDCPCGLYKMKDDGSLGEAWVKVWIQYRKADPEEGWIDWVVPDDDEKKGFISGRQYEPIRKVFKLPDLDTNKLDAYKYEVRCQCVAKSGNDPARYGTRVIWSCLSHIVEDDFARPGKVLVGVKALATDQLSGGMPLITWRQIRSKVWACTNLGTNAYEAKNADNPAWACYDLIHRAKRIKNPHTREYEIVVKGVPASRIDYQAFERWAAFCDQIVPGTQDEKLCTVNLMIDSIDDLWRTLAKVEAVGRGKVILKGTRYSCIYDGVSEPVQMFTMGNIVKDTFSETFLPLQDRARAVEVSFLNKDKDYQKDILTVYQKDADLNQLNPTQIDLEGVTGFSQAYREAKYRLKLNQYLTRTISFEADVDAIACQVGDVILFQHDAPEWGVGGRIMGATATTVTLDRKVTLEPGKEYQIFIRNTNPDDELFKDSDDPAVEKLEKLDVAMEEITEITELDELTLGQSLEKMPQKYDLYSFGEVTRVAKPFRVARISRSKDFRRQITAIEYDERIYDESSDEIPFINYAAVTSVISDLRATEHTDFNGKTWLDLTWRPNRNYSGARILIDDKQVGAVGMESAYFSCEVTPGRDYQVAVMAVDLFGNDLKALTMDYHVPARISPPDVQEISLDEDTYIQRDGSVFNNITVGFEQPSNVQVHYEIYYDINESGNWKGPVSVAAPPYTMVLPNAGKVQVKVVTVDNHNQSLRSTGACSEVYQITGKSDPPPNVTCFSAVQDEYNRSRILLIWDPIDETANPDLKGYEIRLGETWENATAIGGTIYDTKAVYQVPVNLTNPPEGNYQFWIKSLDNSGNYSLMASEAELSVIVRPNAPTAPLPPKAAVIQDLNNRSKLTVSWEEIVDKDLVNYEVRQGSVWETARIVGTTKETWIEDQVSQSGNYQYIVRGRNLAGYLSNLLHLTTVSPVAVEPPEVTGFRVSQDKLEATKIILEWGKPPALDVDHYIIKEGLSWDDPDSMVLDDNVTKTGYEFRINQEREYTFWVKAVTIGGFESQYPASISGFFSLNPPQPEHFTVVQDPDDRSLLHLNWNRVSQLDILEYELRVGPSWESELTKVVAKTKELKADFSPANSGSYKFMLKARNNAFFESDETVLITDDIRLEPADVTGFAAVQNGVNVLMVWDKNNELDLVGYEIREGPVYENGVVIAAKITDTICQIPVTTAGAHLYQIKAINRSGRYSQNPTKCKIDVINLTPKNIILSINELETQNGDGVNTEFGPGLKNFNNLEGTFTDYPEIRFNDFGGQIVLKLKGDNLITDPEETLDWTKTEYTAVAGVMAASPDFLPPTNPVDLESVPGDYLTIAQDFEVTEWTRGKFYGRIYYFDADHQLCDPACSDWTELEGIMPRTRKVKTYLKSNFPAGTRFIAFDWGWWSESDDAEGTAIVYGTLVVRGNDSGSETETEGRIHYPDSGEYFTTIINMGRLITANISTQFKSSVLLQSGVNAKIFYQISRDQHAEVWGEWTEFKPVTATFWYLRFKVVLTTFDRTKTPEVNLLKIEIDVPDIDKYGTAQVPSNGLEIYFGYNYQNPPCVIATATTLGQRAEITGVENDRFNVMVTDSGGQGIAGNISWFAKGY